MKDIKSLTIGVQAGGGLFTLPFDAVTRTFAIFGIIGSGKTTAAVVMAEEMCKVGLPWICFDPIGVWWGIRARVDGSPGGFPVVIVGGQNGDMPLDRLGGAQLARALIAEPICAVIDLKLESKAFRHTFITEFCKELLRLSPESPRHIFFEEAPELVPQKAKFELTQQCKEAVTRLISLGRNSGYGCTLISQRPATVDKDVLSQCENLLVMRTVGKHDRKALMEWVEGNASDRDIKGFVDGLASLRSGTGYFWSPQWLRMFKMVRIRMRQTFHPGATRTVGQSLKPAVLSDVRGFVSKLELHLKKEIPKDAAKEKVSRIPSDASSAPGNRISKVVAAPPSLSPESADWKKKFVDAEKRLAAVRKLLEPQYKALCSLFGKLGSSVSAVDATVWEPWLAKAGGRGCRRMLQLLIEKGELGRSQLGTLSGVPATKSTFRNYLSWMKTNGLITVEGDIVRLNQP